MMFSKIHVCLLFHIILDLCAAIQAPYHEQGYSNYSSISLLFGEYNPSFGGIVEAYELSMRSTFDPHWRIYGDQLGASGRNKSAAQVVSVRVDEGKTVTSGTFTLGILYSGLNPEDFEHAARTPRIPWDATSAQMKSALATLTSVRVLTVKRCDEFGTDSVSHGGDDGWFHMCPYGNRGGFRWLIVFESLARDVEFPKLYAYREDLGNTWTGVGEQVLITRVHGGAVTPKLCRNSICSVRVTGLSEATPYVFRLRAHQTVAGWTDYSSTSEPILTAARRVPTKPRMPRVMSVQPTTITYRVAAAAQVQAVTKFESQYKVDGMAFWEHGPSLEINEYAQEYLEAYSLILEGLQPDTSYVVRVRAFNDMGPGPYSAPSSATKTASNELTEAIVLPPVITEDDIHSNSIAITITAEPDAASTLYTEEYLVQYKLKTRENWLTLPDRVLLTTRREGQEVQEISVRADSSSGCNGKFFLELKGTYPDLADSSVTSGISFSATEAEFVNAVLDIPRIRRSGARVSARRVLNAFNGYTWILDIMGMGNIPKFHHNRNDLTSADDPGEVCWSGAGFVVSIRTVKDGDDVLNSENATVQLSGLVPQTAYDVRVQRKDSRDSSLQSSEVLSVTTKPAVSVLWNESAKGLKDFFNPTLAGMYSVGAAASSAARSNDFHYAHGSAVGGANGESGADGHCVIVSFREKLSQPYASHHFFYTGKEEIYTVPVIEKHRAPITRLTVKCWGGGGGGGILSNYDTSGSKSTLSEGGGGAFAQATLVVRSGEKFSVLVGGGGKPPSGEYGGLGGFGGGGTGGNAIMGGGGGGGGGASFIRAALDGSDVLVLVAAGGGGGGSTDYCCSGGGGGGSATEGGKGDSPGENTPWPITGGGITTPVARRHEYTSDHCALDIQGVWCTSPWDLEARSLPAEHLNLEYGESPNSNYSLWSEGGLGGTADGGGVAGVSGGYEVLVAGDAKIASFDNSRSYVYSIDSRSSMNPFPQQGRLFSGGQGAGGKKGGGGGGSGYFGGGGGGSGVDAAGGGGGSSYVNEELVVNNRFAISRTVATLEPRLTYITNAEAEVAWSGVWTDAKGEYPRGYVLEIATGNYSEDFSYVATVNVDKDITNEASMRTYTYLISGLESDAIYSFRTLPILTHGRGTASNILKVKTLSVAQNYWEPVFGHRNARAATARGLTNPVTSRPHLDVGVEKYGERVSENSLRVTDAITADTPALPSSRRGHTLSLVDDYVYMFGGRTDGYTCAYTMMDTLNLGTPESGREIKPCASNQNEVSELWLFNIYDYRWTFQETGAAEMKPTAREQHSAGVMDGDIYVFGGKSRGAFPSTADRVYNDFWRLNIEDPLVDQYDWYPTVPEPLVEGQRNKYSIDLSSVVDPYSHSTDHTSSRTGACISAIVIKVEFTHPCVRQLRISLQGPGPSSGSPNYHPHSCDEEVLLFDHTHQVNDTACARGKFTFMFDEDGPQDPLECCSRDGNHHFRPDGRLYEYAGASPFVDWTLIVEDMSIDGQEGELLGWSIEYSVEPCNRNYSWTKIVPTNPSSELPVKRYQANMIVYESSIFVFGGRGDGDKILTDLYRFDLSSNSWTVLSPVSFDIPFGSASMVGMNLALTKWGLIRFGGYVRLPSLVGNRMNTYVNDVFIMDPISLRWKLVEVESSATALEPAGRYLSGIVFIPAGQMRWRRQFSYRSLFDQRIKSTHANFAGSLADSLLVFGGHNGATGSLDDGSTGGMLNDMWQLRLSNWSLVSNRGATNAYVDYYCAWRLSNTSSVEQLCLSTTSGTNCELRDLILMSWCQGKNQTIA